MKLIIVLILLGICFFLPIATPLDSYHLAEYKVFYFTIKNNQFYIQSQRDSADGWVMAFKQEPYSREKYRISYFTRFMQVYGINGTMDSIDMTQADSCILPYHSFREKNPNVSQINYESAQPVLDYSGLFTNCGSKDLTIENSRIISFENLTDANKVIHKLGNNVCFQNFLVFIFKKNSNAKCGNVKFKIININ